MLPWSPTNVLMSGHQPNLVDFDFNTAQETQVVRILRVILARLIGTLQVIIRIV